MKKESVSVIINTYKENPEYLRSVIKSFKEQKGNIDLQLIVSTVEKDISIDIVKEFKDIVLVKSKEPGIFKQLDKALSYVDSEWLTYSSGHDIPFPDKLIREINLCKKNKKKICYSSFYECDGDMNVKKVRSFVDYDFKEHLEGNYVSDCAMVNTALFKEFLPMKHDNENMEYYNIWLRIALKYPYAFIYNPNPTWYYRISDVSQHIKRGSDSKWLKKVEGGRKKMLSEFKDKIVLSVGLPLFDSAKIQWLALESLCNQKGIDFKWELIIAEEQEGDFYGKKVVDKYFKRLSKVGCIRIKYIPLAEWITLSEKWRVLIAETSDNSGVFVLQAADCYSEPNRLVSTYEKIVLENYDWISNIYGVYYDLRACKEILYDHTTLPKEVMTGLNMALKMDLARQLPDENLRRSVDGWIYRSIEEIKDGELKVYFNKDDSWKKGLDTHGLNKISRSRNRYWDNEPKIPFRKTDIKIKDILPVNIYKKLLKVNLEYDGVDIEELSAKKYGTTIKHKFFTKYYSKPISQVQRKVQCFGSG